MLNEFQGIITVRLGLVAVFGKCTAVDLIVPEEELVEYD